MTVYVNYVTLHNGRVSAICEHCGKRSKSTTPGQDGEPRMWELSGWSSAPYPHDFKHDNGSTGSTWTCPACNKRLRAGEALPIRGGGWARQIV